MSTENDLIKTDSKTKSKCLNETRIIDVSLYNELSENL